MNEKRKKAQDFILKHISAVDPSGKNTERYKKKFAAMSDKEFDDYMWALREKNEVIYFYAANMVDTIKIPDLIAAAKGLGIKLFERIRMWDEPTQSYYLTPHEYFIIKIPVRRMSQFVDHKLSVGEGDKKIDLLSGQVVKPDKGNSLSQVEIQALYARGLEHTIKEMIKFRGGDVVAFAEYKRELEETGTTTIDKETGSVVRSAVILDVLMSGMHIESNASGV